LAARAYSSKTGRLRRERDLERRKASNASAAVKAVPAEEAGRSEDDGGQADEEELRHRFEKRERAVSSGVGVGVKASKSHAVAVGVVAALVLLGVVGAYLLTRPSGNGERADARKVETAPTANGGQSDPQTGAPKPPAGMVYVPGGTFTMGRKDSEEYESPAHDVKVDPFFIGIHEVTNKEYAEFLMARPRHAAPPGWRNRKYAEGAEQLPVTGVTWPDAVAYCEWLSGKVGARVRLPTEEEWEFAARGPDGRLYPWGSEWRGGIANVNGNSLAEVGEFNRGCTPEGVCHMIGNVWEWTASEFKPYPGGQWQPPQERRYVIRGGAYNTLLKFATATYRTGSPPTGKLSRYDQTGFRVVQEVK